MSELIGIREAARRLGVSDTAVHKAIKAGRVSVAGRTEKSDRPLVAWPQVQADWRGNSDDTKRTHVGATGTSKRREAYAGPPPVGRPSVLPTREEVLNGAAAGGEESVPMPGVSGPSLAQSRAIREAYQARLAKMDFDERSGKLIDAASVKVSAFKMARTARDALMTLPDRLAPVLASATDVREVHALLLADIERTCKRLADDALAQ